MLDTALLDRAKEAAAAGEHSGAVLMLEQIQIEKLCRGELKEVAAVFELIPAEKRAASMIHCVQEIQLDMLCGRFGDIRRWYAGLVSMRDGVKEGSAERVRLEICISSAGMMRPKTEDAKLLLAMAAIFNELDSAEKAVPVFVSLTGKSPSVIHGRKDISDWCMHYGAVTSIIKPLIENGWSEGARGVIECARAEMFYERGDLSAATVESAGTFSARDPEVLFAGYAQLARLYSLDPATDYSRVLGHIGKMIEERGADWLLPNFNALKVRFLLLGGDTGAAEEWMAGAGNEWDGITPDAYYEMATKARVYIALGRYREAMTLLEQLLQLLSDDIRPFDRADCLAYEAVACERLGSGELALEKLGVALRLMEPYGFIRVFADIGTPMLHLLMRFAKENSPQGGFARYIAKAAEAAKGFSLLWPRYLTGGSQDPQGLEPVDLTAAEVQILQLLAGGKSNGEIADALGAKLPTVKFHLKNIYEKLGVSSRTAALSAATKRGMI